MAWVLVQGQLKADDPNQEAKARYQIKSFRFFHHSKKEYDRLVIQMGLNKRGKEKPAIRLVNEVPGKEAVVYLDNITLHGSIPEAAINDNYSSRSLYLGPLTVNTDDPSGNLTIRVFLKNPVAVAEAFWLEKPSRLVIDVFPPHSIRSAEIKKPTGSGRKASATDFLKRIGIEGSGSGGGVISIALGKGLEPMVCYPISKRELASFAESVDSQPKPEELKPKEADNMSQMPGISPAQGLAYPQMPPGVAAPIPPQGLPQGGAPWPAIPPQGMALPPPVVSSSNSGRNIPQLAIQPPQYGMPQYPGQGYYPQMGTGYYGAPPFQYPPMNYTPMYPQTIPRAPTNMGGPAAQGARPPPLPSQFLPGAQ